MKGAGGWTVGTLCREAGLGREPLPTMSGTRLAEVPGMFEVSRDVKVRQARTAVRHSCVSTEGKVIRVIPYRMVDKSGQRLGLSNVVGGRLDGAWTVKQRRNGKSI